MDMIQQKGCTIRTQGLCIYSLYGGVVCTCKIHGMVALHRNTNLVVNQSCWCRRFLESLVFCRSEEHCCLSPCLLAPKLLPNSENTLKCGERACVWG